ncbi:NAD(P)/FAD-dependent oxidoreductase [Deinococcus depolymerans]|uniref:FAD/NAD(P)-binding domain-containing protein n=1 Tax=Deinococcus depolymerans TaxID=392408 RepID=A0ABP3LR29_9DEIO
MTGRPVTRIVILASGGLDGTDVVTHVTRALRRHAGRRLRSGQVQVTLVGGPSEQAAAGFTGEFLGGLIRPGHLSLPARTFLPEVRVRAGAAQVDLDMQRVLVEEGGVQDWLPFDQLILTRHAASTPDRLPGQAEHTYQARNGRDLQRLRTALDDRCREGQPTRVAVVGGGRRGVEVAAAIRDRLTRARVAGEVHLLCSGPLLAPLNTTHPDLTVHVRGTLTRLDVRLHEGQRVSAFRAGEVCTVLGPLLRADLIVYAASGRRRVPLPGSEALRRDRQGRVLTDRHGRTPDYPNVWVADTLDPPQLGDQVARTVLGRSLRPPGPPEPAALGLGRRNSVTQVMGLTVTGAIGWAVRVARLLRNLPRPHGTQLILDLLRPPAPAPPPQRLAGASDAAD